MPVSSVSLFERGKRRPSLVTLIRLADVFMVSIDYFVGRPENPLAHTPFGDSRVFVTDIYAEPSAPRRFGHLAGCPRAAAASSFAHSRPCSRASWAAALRRARSRSP